MTELKDKKIYKLAEELFWAETLLPNPYAVKALEKVGIKTEIEGKRKRIEELKDELHGLGVDDYTTVLGIGPFE